MLLKLSNWLVSTSLLENAVCVVSIEAKDTLSVDLEATDTIEVEVDTLRCERQIPTTLYALQNSGRNYQFTDVDANLDFSAATVITFGVWETIASGSTQLITEDLTSGVSVIDTNVIQVSLEDSDLAVPTGAYWWELWATIGSDNKVVGRGDFRVQDTRKFD